MRKETLTTDELIKKLGYKAEVIEIDGEPLLCIGGKPKDDKVLKQAVDYRRSEQDCVGGTESMLRHNKADGHFRSNGPQHRIPALKTGLITYTAYDYTREPVAHTIFHGTKKQVGKMMENYDRATGKLFGKDYKYYKK